MSTVEFIPTIEEELMSPNDFAAAIGVRPGNVKRWRSEGMSSFARPDGSVVIETKPAIEWLKSHARLSTFGKRLLPLWELAVRTKNLTLRRLVLRYEVEVEGVSIGGRLVA